MASTHRTYIDIGRDGSDDPAVKRGLSWLLTEASRLNVSEAGLAVPGLKNIDYLSHIIPDVDRIKKEKSFTLKSSSGQAVTVHVITERAQPLSPFVGPIFVCWATPKTLSVAESLTPPAICVLPWVRKELENWIATWDPPELLTGSRIGKQRVISNPVVAEALRFLHSAANVSTGLDHPSDEEMAWSIFQLLRDQGEDFEPDEIQSWASRNSWTERGISDLIKIAGAVKSGRSKASSRKMLRDDVIEKWRNAAHKGGPE